MNCPHCGKSIEPKARCAKMVQPPYSTTPHRCPFNAVNGKFCRRHTPENLTIERDKKLDQLKQVVAHGKWLLKQFKIDEPGEAKPLAKEG